jgi:peptidyl-prolyl cis-trans isomerase D
MGLVLGMIAVSFAIWGIGDIFRGFGRSAMARVGGTEISIEAFRQMYTDRLQVVGKQQGRPLTLAQARAAGVDQQVVNQLIAEATLDERVKALRLGISSAEIARRIQEDPGLRGPSGRFDRALFDQMLRQISTTEKRYVEDQRRGMLRRQLAATILNGTMLPKAATEAAERYQNEQRTIEYVLLDRAHAGEIPAPTEEELAKFFQERKNQFRAPEYRKVTVLALLPGEQALWLTVSDADVQRAYQERRARYLTPERRTLQQIRFDTVADAQAAADRIAKGTSFLDIATEMKLTEQDINLGTLTQSQIIDPAVGQAAFALHKGAVTAPVQGRFGTVLIRVVDIEPETVRPFEQVREELRKDLQTERARAEILPIYDKIEDERSIGRSLAETAAQLKLGVRTLEIDANGRDMSGAQLTDIPLAQRVIPAAFATDPGVENEPLQADGGYVWYEVTGITPARDRTLDEVRSQVEASWRDNEYATRIRAQATEILAALKEGKSLPAIAKERRLAVQTKAEIKRGSPSAPISVRALDTIFRTPKDEFASADADAPGEQIVFRVTDITMPEIDASSEAAQKAREALARTYVEDVFNEYITLLRRQVGVTINQNALKQVVTGQSPSSSN